MAETVLSTNIRIDKLEKLAIKLVTVLGAWLGALSVAIFTIHGDISAIKQAESMNGTAIISRLEKPPSIDQLKQDLAITSAKIELQKATVTPTTKVKPSSFKGLDTALLQVTASHPDLPQAWTAAAQLVSYKSLALNPPTSWPPACDVNHMKVEQRTLSLPGGGLSIAFGYFFANCTLTLEDIPPQNQNGASPFPFIHTNGKVVFPIIHLDNGLVVYRGGVVDKSNDSYVFKNCRFDFSVNGVPPSPVRDVLEAALKQPSLNSVEINLPNAAPA